MRPRRFPPAASAAGFLAVVVLAVYGPVTLAGQQQSRIGESIDETKLVRLTGNTHRLVQPQFDQGAVDDSLPMEHMYLQLQRSPEQEAALQALMREQLNPRSSNYHAWLTAEELGQKFGPSQEEIGAVVQWLESHGFQVNAVSKSGLTIDLSGTAGQVREGFHTEIHNYDVREKRHIANASDPAIPEALAKVVTGMVSLNDFMPKPQLKKPKPNFTLPCIGCPDGFDGSTLYLEAPADFATIYTVAPLYKQKNAITGKGQTVVVLENTDINPADVATFRSAFGLSSYAGKFSQIHPGPGCTDPGTNAAEGEGAIDSEWAGAVAPDANVELASCADTTTIFGGFIAAQNLLDSTSPPHIMSLSYGQCEAADGPGLNAYIGGLWQQAAAEGVSVFVAAGDAGPAACDDFDTATYARNGIAANGFASTPYNVATGGTDFLDAAEGIVSAYWSTTNSATGKSAKSYVPEIPWDDSCASNILYESFGYKDGISFCNSTTGVGFLNIVAGSGAPSFVYAKPYWQADTPGNPNDGKRDLPDISLLAANGIWSHALLLCMSDAAQGGAPCNYKNPTDALFNTAGGTSFTAPQFASIQALINQKAGGPQGNPNPVYYDLARTEYSVPADLTQCNATRGNAVNSNCAFHDVTAGNNNVPCFGTNNCYDPSATDYGLLSTSDSHFSVAYGAHSGWDFATGLGSINVTNIVNLWP
jgi:subtilase family serine protease